MKILHVGNTANFGYYIVKTLRSAGIDAELLMQKDPVVTADPKALDKDLYSGYPEWIHFWDNKNRKSEIRRYMKDKKYDLVHAYGRFPIFAYLSRHPFIAHSLGSDMRELGSSSSFKGILLRRAYHKAKVVLYSTPDQYNYIVKLRLQNGIFLPAPWDYDRFVPQKISNEIYDDKFVIFHPTNLDYRMKGNDRFLQAFAKFVEEHDDVMLLVIDRGPDKQRFRDFIETAGVRDKVKFIPGPMAQSELYYYYSISDVVIDQFALGSVGQIAWEAMSCAKPLIAHIYDDLYLKLYGENPPIFNCKNDNAIYGSLRQLYESKSLGVEVGIKCREWVVKYHNKETFAKRCRRIYDGILAQESIQKIRESIPFL